MAEPEAEVAPMSLKERIAALQLSQVGKAPGQQPASYGRDTNGVSTQRPRPPPPPRPSIPARPNSSNNPPIRDHGSASLQTVGNMPAIETARPALPPRTSTQSSQASSQGPSLPPRRPSAQPSPALPPRRPSEAPSQPEFERSRRGSTDSASSVATTQSSISGISTATSLTSQGERYRIRAPDYDPSSLPALPPKRTKEEKEAADRKYAGVRPLRQSKSTPKVAQVQQGTTPPPSGARHVSDVVRPPVPSVPRPAPDVIRPPVPSQPGPAPSVIRPPPPSVPKKAPSVIPPPLPGRGPAVQEQQLAIEPAPAKNGWVSKTKEPVIPSLPTRKDQHHAPEQPPWPVRAEVLPPPRPRQSALSFGMNKSTNTPPPLPDARPGAAQESNGDPPPIPSTSKPDLAALQASKPKSAGAANGGYQPTPQGACMTCRDFSGPDNHAARFPRESIPSKDLGWLAHQLTSPFPSATDKARAIFTWEHHNIAYDHVAFFTRNVQRSTPQSTFETGLAVCEGYATLFSALALKAGLESIVVSGHGKGFGYAPMNPGDPVPPFSASHAWNAVKIDGGEWKLIDCCWGAGKICPKCDPVYTKKFSPERFTQSNEDFGLDHFPSDNSHQFRRDGRPVTWEAYIRGDNNTTVCTATIYGDAADEGLSKNSFRPAEGKIVLAQQGPTIRFSFQKFCPHWDPIKNGKGDWYLYVLCIDALKDQPKRGYVPFQTNGEVWWCDVPTQDLGGPGMKVHIYAMTQFDGKNGRGLKTSTFKEKMGRVGCAFAGVGMWELA